MLRAYDRNLAPLINPINHLELMEEVVQAGEGWEGVPQDVLLKLQHCRSVHIQKLCQICKQGL